MFTVWVAVILNKLLKERDLGVLTDNQLNFHNHSSTAVGKARRLLGLVSQSFINLTPLTSSVVFTKLLKTNP